MSPTKVYALFFFLIVGFGSFAQNKLPKADAIFLNKYQKHEMRLYEYFKKYIGTVSDKKKKQYNGSKLCHWEEAFKHNIYFRADNCNGTGMTISATFIDYAKEDIVKLVDAFYKTFDNDWNVDQSVYEPSDKRTGYYVRIMALSAKTIRLSITYKKI